MRYRLWSLFKLKMWFWLYCLQSGCWISRRIRYFDSLIHTNCWATVVHNQRVFAWLWGLARLFVIDRHHLLWHYLHRCIDKTSVLEYRYGLSESHLEADLFVILFFVNKSLFGISAFWSRDKFYQFRLLVRQMLRLWRGAGSGSKLLLGDDLCELWWEMRLWTWCC